jgi:hypothetical protein
LVIQRVVQIIIIILYVGFALIVCLTRMIWCVGLTPLPGVLEIRGVDSFPILNFEVWRDPNDLRIFLIYNICDLTLLSGPLSS